MQATFVKKRLLDLSGMGLRSAYPLANSSINTVSNPPVSVGAACVAYRENAFGYLPFRPVQWIKIWAFYYSKLSNVPERFKRALCRVGICT